MGSAAWAEEKDIRVPHLMKLDRRSKTERVAPSAMHDCFVVVLLSGLVSGVCFVLSKWVITTIAVQVLCQVRMPRVAHHDLLTETSVFLLILSNVFLHPLVEFLMYAGRIARLEGRRTTLKHVPEVPDLVRYRLTVGMHRC